MQRKRKGNKKTVPKTSMYQASKPASSSLAKTNAPTSSFSLFSKEPTPVVEIQEPTSSSDPLPKQSTPTSVETQASEPVTIESLHTMLQRKLERAQTSAQAKVKGFKCTKLQLLES